MPITVEQTIKVADVRKGDVFAADHAEVVAIQHKQVWAMIQFGSGHDDRRLRRDATVQVLREQLTEEEKEANKRMFMVEGVREHLLKLLSGDPLSELQEAIEKYNPAYGELLSSYNLPGILKTQARYRVGLRIRTFASNAAERHNVEIQLRLDDNLRDDVKALGEDVLLDAFAMWYYESTDRRYRVGPQDPTSRSTSV